MRTSIRMRNPFQRFFGKGRQSAVARKAELRGDLERAVEVYADAGQPEEAARVMVLRGDAEADARKRLLYYTQAVGLAPTTHEIARVASQKRALLIVALVGGDGGDGRSPTAPAARRDLLDAARTLEEIGDQVSAADAYRRAGDIESEARALAQGGEVDKLEWLLTEQQTKDREVRRKEAAHRELELLVASGRRREALALAETAGMNASNADALRARRACGPVAKIVLRGAPMNLVLGDEVVVGRTEGSLQIASAAVSRRHLLVMRKSDGVVVRDLESRNGTLLRGLALAGETHVGDGIELRLGKEVPLRITPSTELPGAVAIELAGTRYLAPLGAAVLRIGDVGHWRLEVASDGWIELVTSDGPPGFVGGAEVVPRATLLVGDAVTLARTGEAVLRMLG